MSARTAFRVNDDASSDRRLGVTSTPKSGANTYYIRDPAHRHLIAFASLTMRIDLDHHAMWELHNSVWHRRIGGRNRIFGIFLRV